MKKPDHPELELVRYDGGDRVADFSLDLSKETVWATQPQIAELFGVERSVITKHLKNIFDSKELDEDRVCAIFAQTGADGKTYQVRHYDLDAILSVGYRVSSAKATEFRRWATKTLKEYLVQGFALNEARLKDDPRALRQVAARIRALRADEINIYKGVRDVFAFGSIDYDPDSKAARAFFAKLTDKFLYAATGKVAAELILERADHRERNMGLQTMKSDRPNACDVDIGKNYLVTDELYRLHILCEQWLLLTESKALRGQTMTMAEMIAKFDELLELQGHSVFAEYKEYLRQRAKDHAMRELSLYRDRIRAEARAAIT